MKTDAVNYSAEVTNNGTGNKQKQQEMKVAVVHSIRIYSDLSTLYEFTITSQVKKWGNTCFVGNQGNLKDLVWTISRFTHTVVMKSACMYCVKACTMIVKHLFPCFTVFRACFQYEQQRPCILWSHIQFTWRSALPFRWSHMENWKIKFDQRFHSCQKQLIQVTANAIENRIKLL